MDNVDSGGQAARRSANRSELWRRLALTIAWVALASIAILAVAIAAGLWLDLRLNTRPAFTILFVLISFPITLLLITRIVRRTTRQWSSARSRTPDGITEDDRGHLKQT
jgi:F0F1-type ATP synthase assembly protein I